MTTLLISHFPNLVVIIVIFICKTPLKNPKLQSVSLGGEITGRFRKSSDKKDNRNNFLQKTNSVKSDTKPIVIFLYYKYQCKHLSIAFSTKASWQAQCMTAHSVRGVSCLFSEQIQRWTTEMDSVGSGAALLQCSSFCSPLTFILCQGHCKRLVIWILYNTKLMPLNRTPVIRTMIVHQRCTET